ncbi:uncharacterized protein LOC128549735 [Mercenaria mercenaria]|uniref:uncharacterized protein LOC128549735 n=1 Tax=Mercenaria mercenaria TaxID=6596 RepID=UPI00234ED0CF|nr:uncharacterized protein LOC128549735 [Mercenaria mercenaria]
MKIVRFHRLSNWQDRALHTDSQSIRYLENTLSDEKSVFRAVLHATPYEHTSALYKAYSYAAAHNKFLWSEFPASNIAPCDRPTFKAMAEEFVQKEEEHRLYVLYETSSLRPWQAYVLERTRSQTDRQITWIYDVTGNSGKTFLALYMVATCNAYLIDGHNKGDIARAYNKQPLVVFSYARQTDDSGINYGLMENFKDGYLWSPKYDSKMMFFNSCKVLVMCNCKPDLEKLSPDRWDCFSQTLQGLRPGLLD